LIALAALIRAVVNKPEKKQTVAKPKKKSTPKAKAKSAKAGQ
jgi:hypothetical protein